MKDTRWNENKIEKLGKREINLRGTSSGEVGVALFTYQIPNPGVYDIGCRVRFKRKHGGGSNPAYTVIVAE